jgi:hypothetical protein
LEIKNQDSTSSNKSIVVSPRFGKVFIYDNEGKLKIVNANNNDQFRFLSVDPVTNKYPELTPYQFASNSPISGIDQDGLEFMKYDKKNTGTIVFSANEVSNNETIRDEYNRAMKSDMNVVQVKNPDKSKQIAELGGYLKQKGTKYSNLIFTGHGTLRYSSLKLGGEKYLEDSGNPMGANNLHFYKEELAEIGHFVKKDGNILLLGCFQATPKYQDAKLEVNLDGESLTRELSSFTNRSVIGSQGSVSAGANEFSGTYPLSGPYPTKLNRAKDDWKFIPQEQKFYGQWSITQPNGNITPIGEITLNAGGQWAPATLTPHK